MKRVDIKTNFQCNNHCRFCVQGDKRHFNKAKSTSQVKRILESARETHDSVVFTGGEITIRKDILELVKHAKDLGYQTIQLQSNGRMFAYQEFCDSLIAAGANQFSPALHGHIAKLHDYLTCSEGSFMQTLTGIKNLKRRNQDVIVNCVVTKPNYRHLFKIAKMLVSLEVDQYQFAFVHAGGTAGKNFDAMVPRKTLAVPYMKEGLDVGIKRGIKVMTEAIPYCFMKNYEDYIAEKYIPDTKIYDADRIVEDFSKVRKKQGKAKGPQCKRCRYYSLCEGPWKEYPDHFGWGEFIPVEKNT